MERNELSTIALMKSHRDLGYLEFVRSMSCCVSNFPGEVVAHHVRMWGGGGTGLKPSDYLAVPLTNPLHQALHQHGEQGFWMHYEVKPLEYIEGLLADFLFKIAGEDIESIFKTLTGDVDKDVRALIEAVATKRGTL